MTRYGEGMDGPNDEAALPEQIPELLAYVEQNLSHATLRLGRLRSRNRGGPLSKDLTAVFYDLQAARQAVVGALEAMDPDAFHAQAVGHTPES